jgi:hypothetical protein
MTERLTPIIVARSQVLTALDLFFEDRDPVSVHALAGNAREILESLCRLEGLDPMTSEMLGNHPGKSKKWLYGVINLYRNCFKHLGKTEAERSGDQATLDQFDDRVNGFLLYVCVEDYFLFRRAMPIAFQVFQAWFCALNLDLIVDPAAARIFRMAFPGLPDLPPATQKKTALEVLRKYSNDRLLLDDPRTEII